MVCFVIGAGTVMVSLPISRRRGRFPDIQSRAEVLPEAERALIDGRYVAPPKVG
jgi:hypothetical protein